MLQLEASAQQTLFSWFVMALHAERGSAGRVSAVRRLECVRETPAGCEDRGATPREVRQGKEGSQQLVLALLGGRVHLRMEHRQRRKRHRK